MQASRSLATTAHKCCGDCKVCAEMDQTTRNSLQVNLIALSIEYVEGARWVQ